ncbi:FMN-binding negative transcriptional regulator [Plantactinospora sp. B6F1]|uniref:FMN-binding negative transcriptional regulator n=1 Tax=Plantactinospora sp. B6F1 TaxID=3158971 RepID=UPI0032D8D3D8
MPSRSYPYLTDGYRSSDPDQVLHLIDQFPLATLLPEDRADRSVTFLPVIIDPHHDAQPALLGHLDKSNPFHPILDGGRVRAIFHGPNGYISPADYVTEQFPTWNYAVAQVVGVSTLIDEPDVKLQHLALMIEVLESGHGTTYRFDPEAHVLDGLLARITFFRLVVDSMDATFKFSQDKVFGDRLGAYRGLLNRLHARQERAVTRFAEDVAQTGQRRPAKPQETRESKE